jgi:hypothetical protein
VIFALDEQSIKKILFLINVIKIQAEETPIQGKGCWGSTNPGRQFALVIKYF